MGLAGTRSRALQDDFIGSPRPKRAGTATTVREGNGQADEKRRRQSKASSRKRWSEGHVRLDLLSAAACRDAHAVPDLTRGCRNKSFRSNELTMAHALPSLSSDGGRHGDAREKDLLTTSGGDDLVPHRTRAGISRSRRRKTGDGRVAPSR